MENLREDIKEGLLKKISEFVEKDSHTTAHEWVVIFGKFLTALDIEANIPKKE